MLNFNVSTAIFNQLINQNTFIYCQCIRGSIMLKSFATFLLLTIYVQMFQMWLHVKWKRNICMTCLQIFFRYTCNRGLMQCF